MKRLYILLILVVALFTGGVIPAAAQGVILPPPCPMDGCPPWGVFTNPDWLKVDYHRVPAWTSKIRLPPPRRHEVRQSGEALAEGRSSSPCRKVHQLTS